MRTWADNLALIGALWPKSDLTGEALGEWTTALGKVNALWVEQAIRAVYRAKASERPKLPWFTDALRAIESKHYGCDADTGEVETHQQREARLFSAKCLGDDEAVCSALCASEEGELAPLVALAVRTGLAAPPAGGPRSWTKLLRGMVYAMMLDPESVASLERNMRKVCVFSPRSKFDPPPPQPYKQIAALLEAAR